MYRLSKDYQNLQIEIIRSGCKEELIEVLTQIVPIIKKVVRLINLTTVNCLYLQMTHFHQFIWFVQVEWLQKHDCKSYKMEMNQQGQDDIKYLIEYVYYEHLNACEIFL